jgi:hypothetical protein
MLTSNAQSSGLRTSDLKKKEEEPLYSDKILYVLAVLRPSYFSKNTTKDNRYENNRGKGSLDISFTCVDFHEILDSLYDNLNRLCTSVTFVRSGKNARGGK